jgi:hypothetical protein
VLERCGDARVRGRRLGQIDMGEPIAVTRQGRIVRSADAQNNELAVKQLSRERRPEAAGDAGHDGRVVTAVCSHRQSFASQKWVALLLYASPGSRNVRP